MYLHLGLDKVVLSRDVIGIFDLDNTTTVPATREFLSLSEKNGTLVTIGTDLPKSLILCQENGQNKVYISQISPQTLVKRAEKKREE
ncbi:MAG TPA: DUF370 domain-containing protein [Clostridiales bacterium]|jgi:hypothetical protein|nr:DUF370 domain-containing protein [Clostridiales bacterium]